jgi:hypothetical protein
MLRYFGDEESIFQCVVHTCIIYEQNYCLTSIRHEIPSLKATFFLGAVLRHFPYIFPNVGQPASKSSLTNELLSLAI